LRSAAISKVRIGTGGGGRRPGWAGAQGVIPRRDPVFDGVRSAEFVFIVMRSPLIRLVTSVPAPTGNHGNNGCYFMFFLGPMRHLRRELSKFAEH
jgi:hypothetical protein